MVTIPSNKILVAGIRGVKFKAGAGLSLSVACADNTGELLLPTLHFGLSDARFNASMLEVDSISARVVSSSLDFYSDVFSMQPKGIKHEFEEPSNIDEYKAFMAEIALVKSLKRIHFSVREREGTLHLINCLVVLNKSGVAPLRGSIFADHNSGVSEELGQYFEARS